MNKTIHCISKEQSTAGMLEGVGIGWRAEGAGAGAACCGTIPPAAATGRAQLISAVTDIVGLSFFAALDMAKHQHPHITHTAPLRTHAYGRHDGPRQHRYRPTACRVAHTFDGIAKRKRRTNASRDRSEHWRAPIYATTVDDAAVATEDEVDDTVTLR
ncbi:hypothetical protein EVAR_13119_1 [Eumeta japonica]|uniref:Uncharacterized protein n=1 Tax=Eumeta variegata TaxID=151549 RepID=A0A4C1U9V3_EUMVA|nr:hypothetical protein EVAR_13119_1 [Eumeta japonica]